MSCCYVQVLWQCLVVLAASWRAVSSTNECHSPLYRNSASCSRCPSFLCVPWYRLLYNVILRLSLLSRTITRTWAHSSTHYSRLYRVGQKVKIMTHWKVAFESGFRKKISCVSWKLSQVFSFRKQLLVISASSILESFLSQTERCDWLRECML